MHTSLKWLALASLTHLVGNILLTVIALQQNLTANFGNFLQGEVSLRDFLTINGTVLLVAMPFWLIQLGLIMLALRTGRAARISVGGLILLGANYTITGLAVGIVLLLSPDGFNFEQAIAFLVNVPLAIAMMVLGISAWRTMRPGPRPRVG